MSDAEKISNDQSDTPIETAVEAKPDSKGKAKKQSVKGMDPINRFSGDGVVFRAKLFGTADVREPRGDQICATAMNLLKAAVRNTGEHKQKILLKINLNGIVIVDAVSQTKLYEHPVNKISFIAKDPTDNRAFGYVTGEKDGAHVYFGIKTEKAAEQVVLTLKDLFQTVFDMKKKEAEMKGKTSSAPEASKPAAAAAEQTTAEKPAAETPPVAAAQEQAAASKSEEPTLGDATDTSGKTEVKREDSQSHLLDLLDNLSFVSQPPAASMNGGQFGQQANANAAWGGNAVNPSVAPAWGNTTPAQNDPFAAASASGMFSQHSQFSQQPQQQQPQFQQNFSQPNPMSGYNQQAFNPPQQQNPFNTQASFSANPNVFPQQQQAPASNSPFGASGSSTPSGGFNNDPFSSTAFQTNPQAQPTPTTNPFASGGTESFGVLQPQQVPQRAAQASFPQASGNLFSDLNPLPSSNNNVRKEQFFSDVKNPPKPKLNEMQSSQQPSSNSNPFSIQNQSQPAPESANQLDLDWLENRSQSSATNQPVNQPTQSADSTAAPAKQGLLPPPPSNLRQRQSNQGPAAVVRPR